MGIFNKERLQSFIPTVTVEDKNISNLNGETKAIYYTAEPYNGKPTRNFAYIGFPNTEMPDGGYPAVIACHGGGGCAFPEWVEYWNGKGYVCITPDLYGQKDGNITLDCNKSPKNPEGGPDGSVPFEIDLENYQDKWLYHAVCDVIFCNNILRVSKGVNPGKIALTGISWGSVITMMTAGIDDRFCAYAPVYGGGYYYKSPYFSQNHNLPKDEIEWLNTFDPVAYLKKVKKPILFTSGVNDSAFSATCNQKSWELCGENSIYSWRKELMHYHRWKDEENMINVYKFIDNVSNGNQMPFDIVSDNFSGKVLTVKVKNNTQNTLKATLHYTDGDNMEVDNEKLNWTSVVASEVDGVFSAEVSTNATMCFMQITDEQNFEFVLSTKIYFI